MKKFLMMIFAVVAVSAQGGALYWTYYTTANPPKTIYTELGISQTDTIVCLILDDYRSDILMAVADGTFNTSMTGVLHTSLNLISSYLQSSTRYATPDNAETPLGTWHSVFLLVLHGDYAVPDGNYDYYYSANKQARTITVGSSYSAAQFGINDFSGAGSGFGSATVVSEPSAALLALAGGAALLLRRRKRAG